jgi:hypothetical protein
MNTIDIITLARKHIGKGDAEASARICLADAIACYSKGRLDDSKARALKSIAYSVGVFHPDYAKASKPAKKQPDLKMI